MGDYYYDDARSSVFNGGGGGGGRSNTGGRNGNRGGGGGDYDDGPVRYQTTKTRPRRRDDADYVEETTFIERGKGKTPQELIYRGRDADDDVEEVQRDFSPPGGGRRPRGYDDYGSNIPRRAKSAAAREKNRFDDDKSRIEDDFDDYGGAGAGALAGGAAGYAAGRRGRNGGRRRRDSYYSDDDRSQVTRGKKPERKKSGIEGALAGLGLGGIAGAITGKRSRSGSRERDGGRSRSRPRGEKKQREWAQAAQAALIAGAVEAFKSRGEEGPWTGAKGRRVATAAIGAGGIDKLVDRDPDHKSKRHLVEAVLGGLAANRLANGPTGGRSKSRGRGRSSSGSPARSRSRSVFSRYRSKSRGRGRSTTPPPSGTDKLKDLAAGGLLAGVGKQLYDQYQKHRSKSRGGGERNRSLSASGSEDSYAGGRGGRGRDGRDRDVGGPSNGDRGGPDAGAVGLRGGAAGGGAEEGEKGSKKGSDTETLSSTDMENRRKKTVRKEYLTAALASIATIHAAHGVYNSMEGSEKRHKLVQEGKLTPEEARKRRSKAWLQDAAAIGIAALGIKGAYSEWKEMNEQRHSVKELEERRKRRARKRAQRAADEQRGGGGRGGGDGREGGDGKGGGGRSGGGDGGGRRPQQDAYMSGGAGPGYQDANPYSGGGG